METRPRRTGGVGEWVASTMTDGAEHGQGSIPTWRLSEVSVRPPFHRYLAQLWQRRSFIIADARAKAFATSRGTALGKAWLVLRPFLDAMVFFVIFGLLLKTGRGVDNFLAYLIVGMNVFNLTQAGLASGGGILPGAKNLIRAFAFPRAALVLSWALRTLLDFVPVFIATLLFIMAAPPHVMPSATWLFSLPVIGLAWFFSLGTGFVVASLTARLPDLKFIWPLLGRFWFYGSGIFFSVERFADHPMVFAVMNANPGYQVLSMVRKTLVYAQVPTLEEWGYLSVWAFGMLLLGILVFWSHEESYGRES